jgi:uncharacterized membrane protein YeaQ/YmgE (transglycosylase-associated protein family)
MSFSMFVSWVLVGLLVGLLAGLVMKQGGYGLKRDITLGLVGSIGAGWIVRGFGIFPSFGMLAMAVIVALGAAIAIVAQRRFLATDHAADERGAIWRWGLGVVLVGAVIWMIVGPAPQPAATAAATIEDKTYAVTPATLKVKAGIVTGEVTELKVMERVEQGSGRIASAAKLTGRLALKNTSPNQTVRLVAAKLLYIDGHGQPIKLEDARTEPALRFGSSSDRLDPGQEATESLDVEFPAEALKAGKLAQIRLDLAYVPTPYREETLNFPVRVGATK